MERFLLLIRNKYLIAGVAFVVWMCFFDRYDVSTQYSYLKEEEKLRTEKEFYESETVRIEKAIIDVQENQTEIQRIARERYKMKKDNEDVYVIKYVSPSKD
ncbi:MAG: FtsB family cell division protein [Sphingobacterium sp.]|uniref:FtsB family cell division protein n=1 Tax=Sphingobacterium sp. JB170 TaxID=1434842 RepID=UPI00097F35E6|nr:septum formation initiator [Sphingobacterium sp. JB170]SJN29380.1 Cell division protein DivIC (FtsB), stabilizes FtsL against RasP cleavage [Sphingobacterium sp. JB170]